MTPRFTIDGSDALEERLAEWCADFAADVRGTIPAPHLEAIVLGGGYGRGEGGVLNSGDGELPYNDLEFYVFVRPPLLLREQQYRRRFDGLAHHWSNKTGLEFEARLLTFAKLRNSPVSMFYHDLVVGHRWLWGTAQEFVGCEHHRAAHRIPLHEATRLLMNRSSGLLFAAARLQSEAFTVEDSDFIRRNIRKAQLALGDAVLTAFGRYHSSARERHRRLEKLEPAATAPWLAEVLSHHEAGVAFKLHPCKSAESPASLRDDLKSITNLAGEVFLWLEERRLKKGFPSHREYAFDPAPKQTQNSAPKNFLISLRAFGPRGASLRYPRERLLESLALLLWAPDPLRDPAARKKLRVNLLTRDTTFVGLVGAYENIWRRFN